MANVETRVGGRVYMVDWAGGQPFIVAGLIVARPGAKKDRLRVRWGNDPELSRLGDESATLEGAIGKEILHAARRFAPDGVFNRGEPKPYTLALAVVRLMRLYRKLEKHHLVKREQPK